ncbi:putative F-box protein At1g58310 [Silene latifolia]|uniref:putative F-box protein At1g58310 n=1 Tax=Silene latifolia TaxID=37657 RepID=UPI003D780BCE
MDKISSLPDHILSHILSFLPTKNVVATCVLSTRWRYVWASVPILDFDARLHADCYSVFNMNANKSDITFQHFVSRVLLFHDQRIQKFRLIYDCLCPYTPVHTWLRVAISEKMQELELDIGLSVHHEIFDLPKKFFTSSSLVVLKLSGIPFNIPSFVDFPSLKTLELRRISSFDEKCIESLLSGCHALEELVIEEISRMKPKTVYLSIETLRTFIFTYRFVVDAMVDLPYKFFINAPNLTYFHVKGCISDVFVMNTSASLDEAHIDLRQTPVSLENYVVCSQRIFKLFKGIANAKFISFSGEVVQLLCAASNQSLPAFSNLEQLTFGIGFDFAWKRILAEFIICSPHLEELTLNNKEGFLKDMDELSKFATRPLPESLKSDLKQILIEELYGSFMPEQIVYLVEHVNILKRLIINCRCPTTLRSQIGLA